MNNLPSLEIPYVEQSKREYLIVPITLGIGMFSAVLVALFVIVLTNWIRQKSILEKLEGPQKYESITLLG